MPAPQVMVKISTRERMKSAYLKDLSEGGLFVRTDKPLPVGREVVVDLLPPGWSTPLRLGGAVTRVQPSGPVAGMAVQFDQKDAAALGRLKALVAEYTAGPADEGSPWAVDHERQLQQLLERYAELQNAHDQRVAELKGERERREDVARRALELATELEAVKTRGEARTTDAPRLAQLQADLTAAQRETAELRTRTSELEGELAAYKHELEQLESDDATSRRLAANLGREKAELSAEVGRLSRELAEANRRGEELARRGEELARAREERDRTASALETARSENDRLKQQLAVLSARGVELDGASRELSEQLARATGEAATAKAEAAALERRVAQLDAAAKEAQARIERLRQKERELRELLAVVSARGDDVVVVEEGGRATPPSAPQGDEPAGEAPEADAPVVEPASAGEARSGGAKDLEGGPAGGAAEVEAAEAAGDTAVDARAPSATSEVAPEAADTRGVVAPSFPSRGSSPSLVAAVSTQIDAAEPELEAPPASSPSVQLDVDVDLAEAEPVSTDELERRLRANTTLRRSASFDGYQGTSPVVADVKGLLEAGTRLSELMVLGRGMVTPPQLVQALLELLEAGALGFEG